MRHHQRAGRSGAGRMPAGDARLDAARWTREGVIPGRETVAWAVGAPDRLLGCGRTVRPGGEHADEAPPPPAILEPDDAVDARVETVVPAPADVLARLEDRASLPHQDRSARDELAAEALHSQPLGVAVTAVAGTAARFLVGHCSTSLDLAPAGRGYPAWISSTTTAVKP